MKGGWYFDTTVSGYEDNHYFTVTNLLPLQGLLHTFCFIICPIFTGCVCPYLGIHFYKYVEYKNNVKNNINSEQNNFEFISKQHSYAKFKQTTFYQNAKHLVKLGSWGNRYFNSQRVNKNMIYHEITPKILPKR